MNLEHLLKKAVVLCFFAAQTVAQTQPYNPQSALALSSPNEGDAIALADTNLYLGGSSLAPCRYGDRVYFTAILPDKNKKLSRIYSVVGKEKATPISLNPKDEQINIAHLAFNVSGNRVYYTQGRNPKPGQSPQTELWYCNKTFDGKWGNSEKLPNHINLAGSSVKDPALGFDFITRKEMLYFASNRPGGKGGYDIWYSTIEPDGQFGEPVNLPFNTSVDDVSPHFYTQRQTLFFSSNAITGRGGFDIYQSQRAEDGTWGKAENLRQINSNFDEKYFFYHPQSQTNYFCSNRPSANCKGNVYSCTDFSIFTARMGGNLVVKTFNADDGSALYGCNIELEDTSTGMLQNIFLQSEENVQEMPIFPDKKYRLIVSRTGFFPISIELQPASSNSFQTVEQTIMLKPMR